MALKGNAFKVYHLAPLKLCSSFHVLTYRKTQTLSGFLNVIALAGVCLVLIFMRLAVNHYVKGSGTPMIRTYFVVRSKVGSFPTS